MPAEEVVTMERAIALKGSIRLLVEHSERSEAERRELGEFAVELVDRVLGHGNGTSPGD